LTISDLKIEKGKTMFKKNHIVQGKQTHSIKNKFIDAILQKLCERFPENDSYVVYAFAVLSRRP
jgi:hypothetical protein